MTFYTASSIDKQWLSTAPNSHVHNLFAIAPSIDKHIMLFGTSQFFGCNKNPFFLPYLKNPLPYPTFVWLCNFDPPIAPNEVNAQGLHGMHKIMLTPLSLVWNLFKFLCQIGSKMCALLQAFRYDQSYNQHGDLCRGKMKEYFSFFSMFVLYLLWAAFVCFI